MRCLKCAKFSFRFICKDCLALLENVKPKVRQARDLRVYYFYGYDEIKELLSSKHQMHGSFVYAILSKIIASKFDSQSLDMKLNLIPIDDHTKSGYSHTSIIASKFKSSNLIPLYGTLRASNSIRYTGKTLAYRQSNRRNFTLLKTPQYPVILIDDIITTGTTLLEAKSTLSKHNINVICAIVLADARF
ncbi:MAG: ComF family protein [Campylobacter sp.]|nr:ComF family protein [Campylobacter sp.]